MNGELGRELMADRTDKLSKTAFKADEPNIKLAVRDQDVTETLDGSTAQVHLVDTPSGTASTSTERSNFESKSAKGVSQPVVGDPGAQILHVSVDPDVSQIEPGAHTVTLENSAMLPTESDEKLKREEMRYESLESGSVFHQFAPVQKGVSPASRSNAGLTRHRLVIAGCIGLVAGVFALSGLDLKSLCGRDATINSSIQVEYKKSQPDLAPNLMYEDEPRRASYFPYLTESPSNNGLLRVSESNWSGNLIGFVDGSGKVIVKPQFESAGNFHEGLAVAKLTGKSEVLKGYIDAGGKWAISPTFLEAGPFHSGVAPVKTDKSTGFIDHAGHITQIKEPVLPFNPEPSRFVRKFYQGSLSLPTSIGENYVVSFNNHEGIVDVHGNWLLPPLYSFSAINNRSSSTFAYTYLTNPKEDEIAGKYFKITRNSKEGIADFNGNILISPTFETIASFNNGVAAVRVDGEYGFVDTAGKFVIEPTYEDVTSFGELLGVKKSGQWHLMDAKGRQIASPDIDGVLYDHSTRWFEDGLGPVVRKGLCGYVNSKGEVVIPCKFQFVTPFSDGVAAVWNGETWQYIDKHGKFLSPIKFAKISDRVNGIAEVVVSGPLTALSEAQTINTANSMYRGLVEQVWRSDRNPDERTQWGR